MVCTALSATAASHMECSIPWNLHESVHAKWKKRVTAWALHDMSGGSETTAAVRRALELGSTAIQEVRTA